MPVHVPVMAAEVVEALRPARGGLFVDCTVGAGGHARALLAAGATRLVGIDRDGEALDRAREALAEWGDRVALVHGDYRDLARLLDERGVTTVDGAVADLGVSSLQLDGAGRGFSFRRDEALDMRMDTSRGPTAADLVASAGEQVLSDVIFRFGEERRSRAIAHAIVEARRTAPVDTTARLAAIVRRVVGRSGRIDPATRTFQAIRIWVNGELDGLDAFVRAACGRLGAGARLGVITFHSLEDRPVKHTLRALAGESGPLRLVTKKAVVPGAEERRANPRARSARLRVIERME
ncbi:MAG TPA: 16S rRNA (cytosine(1402)-N(4))-methyltransferase RsmH [Vicinamibacterales bacterium]|nr:16S rRNA (cytosine(1402)-N(4))-methyltransferase RsmH [Vicinamibacterales bacterium]HOQ59973.1 16S rRNA (cytosine(1402)-N(4))-methyltransferase RsmH [Vicinamibacterales bacterium]HPK70580.1 16S rRNA (cytosine(1402)-N(4))-methyltransferase RsmH [Vicinamibacterales bacterium]